MILREVIERLGMGRYLAERLDDPRNPDLITHPLIELLHTELLLLGQGSGSGRRGCAARRPGDAAVGIDATRRVAAGDETRT